jgi:hypothetical protein
MPFSRILYCRLDETMVNVSPSAIRTTLPMSVSAREEWENLRRRNAIQAYRFGSFLKTAGPPIRPHRVSWGA